MEMTCFVLGREIKISITDQPIIHQTNVCEGMYTEEALTIQVKAGLHPNRTRGTILHELLHACFDAVGPETFPTKEEDVVRLLEGALFDVFTDPRNREVVDFILGRQSNG